MDICWAPLPSPHRMPTLQNIIVLSRAHCMLIVAGKLIAQKLPGKFQGIVHAADNEPCSTPSNLLSHSLAMEAERGYQQHALPRRQKSALHQCQTNGSRGPQMRDVRARNAFHWSQNTIIFFRNAFRRLEPQICYTNARNALHQHQT